MYCRHCGKQIDDDNSFCPFCGKKLTGDKLADSKDESSKKKNNVLLWVVVVLVIIAIVSVSAVYIINKQTDGKNTADQTAVSEQSSSGEDEEQDEVKDEDIEYAIGEKYCIQTNLRVREGPGKNYRVLKRIELASEDYDISVDGEINEDALLEKGKMVTCQEMSGDWMRITSGWICVYDDGERLVK